ncbi:response regulator [candidate division KSB1 bacterium]|nr:response regulator [candidate division KSB1 bacterium]
MEVLKTLVVDDELGMRMSIKRALTKYKANLPDIDEPVIFDVDVAETGEEALDKINTEKPDVLLLDYKLPGISGLELLEKVTSQDNEMVTIMITAYASIETAVTAVKRGAFDFLSKPFTPDELCKTVSKAAHKLILARRVRKLEQEKHQVRFQFISVLGHELKSPLNSVEGYMDIMKKKTLGEELSAYEKMVDRCLIRIDGMRKLIYDLLDLTRIESGQKKRELQEHGIVKFAETAVETALPVANEKEVSINLEAPDSIRMLCDSGEIEIILNNLISNAVKYNRQKGSVNIALSQQDDLVTISVKDTGIGMSEEEASRLFQEFVRIRNEQTKNIQGSGLGLAIVKKIVDLYHGTIEVKSTPGEGSTFTVILKNSER